MVLRWQAGPAGLALASLVAACQATPQGAAPDPAAGEAPAAVNHRNEPVSSAAAAIDWSRGDCLSQLQALQRAAREGGLGPDAQPPFVVDLVAPPGSWLDGVPDIPLEVDLPLAMADAKAPRAAACVLQIGPARQQRAAHRAIDLQDVHSAYQSGLRRERNPDYDAAQLRQRAAKAQAKGGQKVVRTHDPLLDLVGSAVGGVIATFDRRSRRQALDAAAAELAATPRSLDQPVYRPYSFERVVVRAQKQALVPVALLDATGRRLREVELRQSERREFYVLRGLDPRDRDYEQHRSTSMTRADLARWARTPPTLRLSSVAIALTEDPAPLDQHDDGPDAELLAAWPAGDAAGAGALDSWLDEDAPDIAPVDPSLEEAFAEKESADVPGDDPESPAVALPIAAGPPGYQRGLDVADLVPGLGSRRPTGPAPALAPGPDPGTAPGVVVVHAATASGFGFYVRDTMVLTTAALVGSISVVDVTVAGATVPALVAAVDTGRDLALLQVPRPGPAVHLQEGPATGALAAGPAPGPGYPLLDGDRVVGMTTAAGGPQGVIASDTIRAFLEGQAGVLAAIP